MAGMEFPVRMVKGGQSIWVQTTASYQQKLWEGWRLSTEPTTVPPGSTYVTRTELDSILAKLVLGDFDISQYLTDEDLAQAFLSPRFDGSVFRALNAAVAAGTGLRVDGDAGSFALSAITTGATVESIDAVPGLREALENLAAKNHKHVVADITDVTETGAKVAKSENAGAALNAVGGAPASLDQLVTDLLLRVADMEEEIASLKQNGGGGGGSTATYDTARYNSGTFG